MSRVRTFLRIFKEQALLQGRGTELEDLIQEAWEKNQFAHRQQHFQGLRSQGLPILPGEPLPLWAELPEDPAWLERLFYRFGEHYLSKAGWRVELLGWFLLPLAWQEGRAAFWVLLALLLGYHFFRTGQSRSLKEEYGKLWLANMDHLVQDLEANPQQPEAPKN